MHISILLGDDIGSQLLNGIFSLQFLQFIIAFLSFFGFVMTSAVILILVERKVIAWMQDRIGPFHTGPWGLLQTVADVGKLLLKEDIHAVKADKSLFLLAPSVFMAPVIAAFAVIPFSPYIGLPGTALATGIIYYVAMSSIDVVGVIMAGWSSNNKYSLIGGLRSAAQMISYELPLVLALVSVIMLTSVPANSGLGTISIKDIIDFQSSSVWPGKGIPFWDFIFITKVYLLCFVFIWVRSTLPRLRADQLMQFAWLLLFPVTLGNILFTALVYLVLNGIGLSNVIFLIVLGILNWILLVGFLRLVSRVTVA